MSLLHSIAGFRTGKYTVVRTPKGAHVDGEYVPGTPITFEVEGVIQPAREIARVTAGRDLREGEQNQYVYDVRMLYCTEELYNRNPGYDPDQVIYEGDHWTVIRVERWTISGITFTLAVITRQLNGAA